MSESLGQAFVEFGANMSGLDQGIAQAQRKSVEAATGIESTFMKTFHRIGEQFVLMWGGFKIFEEMKKTMDLGMQAMQTEAAFSSMTKAANINADEMVKAMKRATGGTISEVGLMQKAIKGIAMGMSEEAMQGLAKASVKASIIAGTSVQEAYDSMMDAVSTGLYRRLVRMGALTKQEATSLNKALTAGMDPGQLQEFAVKLIAINDKARDMGNAMEQPAMKMQAMKASVEDTTAAIGKFAVEKLVTALYYIGVEAARAWPKIKSFAESIWDSIKAFDSFTEKALHSMPKGIMSVVEAIDVATGGKKWGSGGSSGGYSLIGAASKTGVGPSAAGGTGEGDDAKKIMAQLDAMTNAKKIAGMMIKVDEEINKARLTYMKDYELAYAGSDERKLSIEKMYAGKLLAVEEDKAVKEAEKEKAGTDIIAKIREAFHYKAIDEEQKLVEKEWDLHGKRLKAELEANKKIIESRETLYNKLSDIEGEGEVARYKAMASVGSASPADVITKEFDEKRRSLTSSIKSAQDDLRRMGIGQDWAYTIPTEALSAYEKLNTLIEQRNQLEKQYPVDIKVEDIKSTEKKLELEAQLALVQVEIDSKAKSTSRLDILQRDLAANQRLADLYRKRADDTTDESVSLEYQVKAFEKMKQVAADLLGIREATGTVEEGIAQGFKDYYENMKTAFDYGKDAVNDLAGTMKDAFSMVFDKMTDKTKSFHDYWISFCDSILKKLEDTLSQMLTNWIMTGDAMKSSSSTGSGGGGFMGMLGGLFGGGGGGDNLAPGDTSFSGMGAANPDIYSSFAELHAGGTAGSDGAFRRAPQSIFYNAPRLHDGLAADEYPAILQKGEPVGKVNTTQPNGANLQVNISGSGVASDGANTKVSDLKFNPAMKKFVANIMIEDLTTNGPYTRHRLNTLGTK